MGGTGESTTGVRDEFQIWVCISGWVMEPFFEGGPGLGKTMSLVLDILSL